MCVSRDSVSRTGDVTYGVNGEDKGMFFSGVDTSRPLWAMLDIYGNTVAVEFSHANAGQSYFQPDPPEDWHLNVKKLPKTYHFPKIMTKLSLKILLKK